MQFLNNSHSFPSELECTQLKIADHAAQDPTFGPKILYMDVKKPNPLPRVSFLAQGVGLVTPAGICYDYRLGLCFFTDVQKDFLYMANINGTSVKPYVKLRIGKT